MNSTEIKKEMDTKKILLTGAAGFIGYKTAELLLKKGYYVYGIDNLNDYYDVRLKEWRLAQLKKYDNFDFDRIDIEDYPALKKIFARIKKFDVTINLAARAGVRYSIKNPVVYMTTNALGTLNLLELMKEYDVKKMVLASTSSLYAGQQMPFKEDLPVNTPISPYAASKKAAETIAYTYHYLYGIDIIILRYFTVYGPAGRPDMSVFRFIRWIDDNKELILFGDGTQTRDFTYVDDIAEGTVKALDIKGYEIINLGNSTPHSLNELIGLIEKTLNKKARVVKKPFSDVDLKATWADIKKARLMLGWKPVINLEEGIKMTIDWYLENKTWVKDIEIDISK
ncbi:MAG: SDR family NAD(P)-dependent oxidoreductase [candidate division WOR-3 bacterium]|nr:SDR family NAD(P)-dependent oxidoreductase [candidate division WOR-3 bacterium]